MKVVFFHRKRRTRNFSIENLFNLVRGALPPDVTWEVKEATHFSEGLWKRFYISIESMFAQGDVNHITGDIHFIAILLKKRRTLLTIHDVVFMKHSGRIARFILRLFWITLPVRRSAVITTVSRATKEELLKYVKVDPAKIHVIYNPILPQFVPATKTFNKSSPTILQIGTKFNKNVPRLIKALAGIPCHLDIVGEVDQSILGELSKAGLSYSISKNLSDNEMVEKYRSADILSFVSTYEGFGMPIVEANAIGRVVVTGNVASMPEVAGDAAHFVDPFDVQSIRNGILKVIEDDAYRESLIENGFRNRMRFDLDEIARQYYGLYSSIAGHPR